MRKHCVTDPPHESNWLVTVQDVPEELANLCKIVGAGRMVSANLGEVGSLNCWLICCDVAYIPSAVWGVSNMNHYSYLKAIFGHMYYNQLAK